MERDSFSLLFTILERLRDAVVRLDVVGLLRKICQNATVTLCLKVSSLHCSDMMKSLSIKRRKKKTTTTNNKNFCGATVYSDLKKYLHTYKCVNITALDTRN